MTGSNPIATTASSPGQDPIEPQPIAVYSSVSAEYEALRDRAAIVDRSHRGRMRFLGEKSGEALTGLVTNDVLSLQPGHGQYGAALSAKGRIIADIRVFAFPGYYLVDTSPRSWTGFASMVKKYMNPRVSGYRDDSFAIRDIGVFGPDARRIVAAAGQLNGDVLFALPHYGHVAATIADTPITVARVPDAGVDGYDLFVPHDAFDRVWAALMAVGAMPAGASAWDIMRIEAGRPEWGVDIDDSTIPQEANFDELDAISYTKGCYIGQEVVARVHFRGHVNRHLRGLRSAKGDSGPPSGAQLIDDSGNHVGDVRSSVVSPRLGAIAIGMVRREATPGVSLNARWDGTTARVDVTPLPFPI